MSWSEALRSMEPRDHVFTVASKEVLRREILPPFVRRAIGLRGEVDLVFPSSDLEAVETTLVEMIPELEKWEASGLVRFTNGDALVDVNRDPTPAGLRVAKKVIVDGYRAALVRGRTLWYVGGVGGHLLEEGLVSQTLFGEMFLQNLHWVVPFAMLCTYYGPVDPNLHEGLEETHDGGVRDPR